MNYLLTMALGILLFVGIPMLLVLALLILDTLKRIESVLPIIDRVADEMDVKFIIEKLELISHHIDQIRLKNPNEHKA